MRWTHPGMAALVVAASCVMSGAVTAQETDPYAVPMDSAEAILQTFADDYASDPSLTDSVLFAISLADDAWWHVIGEPAGDGEEARVQLIRGRPPRPSLLFSLHYPTLVDIHRGEMNPSTAMGRGLASDPALMNFGAMTGFQATEEVIEILYDLAFHFWTRGTPEVVPFDTTLTRLVHGTDAVLLYYQPGFRSAWFNMKPGQHANEDPRLQVNPFPTMIVITRGRGEGRIGDEELELGEGNAVFIPAGVSHEFWNPFDEPVEGLLLMFGEGA